MNKAKIEDEQLVFERYRELGGFVKNGRMINRAKKERAQEYVKNYKELIRLIAEENQIQENSKYGEFIIQTNEVQYYLTKLIFLRSFSFSKKFEGDLERLQLSQLISYLNICAQSELDLELISKLNDYKSKRDALAHKMFTDKKLTADECKKAIRQGIVIINYMKKALKDKQIKKIRMTDRVSDLPRNYNILVESAKSLEKRQVGLEKRVKRLEQEGEKSKKSK